MTEVEQRPVLSKRASEKGEQITVDDTNLKSEPNEPGSPVSENYTIPDEQETEKELNKTGDGESFIGEESQLRSGQSNSRLDNRYNDKSELERSATRKAEATPYIPEP